CIDWRGQSGKTLHRPLRSGERDAAQRVSKGAQESRGTAGEHCGAEVDGRRATKRDRRFDSAAQRAGRSDSEGERPARGEQAGGKSGREQTLRLRSRFSLVRSALRLIELEGVRPWRTPSQFRLPALTWI